jgi:hypothetical protein
MYIGLSLKCNVSTGTGVLCIVISYFGRLRDYQFGYTCTCKIVCPLERWRIDARVGDCSAVVRAPATPAGGRGFDFRWLPLVFLFHAPSLLMQIRWGTLVKFDWSQHIWVGQRICGALVQFGCYQHDRNGRVCDAFVQFNLAAANADIKTLDAWTIIFINYFLFYISALGFNATLESEINQLGDEIFGILRDLENLTAGKSTTKPHDSYS